MNETTGQAESRASLEALVGEHLRAFESGTTTLPILACGPTRTVADAIRRCHHLVPPDWFGATLAYRPGSVLVDLRGVLVGAVDNWLQHRPGLRSLHQAKATLDAEAIAPSQALRDALHDLGGVPGPALFLELTDVVAVHEEANQLFQVLASLQRSGAPVLAIATTRQHVSFLAEVPAIAEVTDVIDLAPASADAYVDVVAGLSTDARRYLRAVVNDPATHAVLRQRLGDSTAFGGAGSRLADDHAEVRDGGLVRLSPDGVIVPVSSAIASLLR